MTISKENVAAAARATNTIIRAAVDELSRRKPPGWCDEQGIAHSWETGPTLTVNPPIQTRFCRNCGKRQRLTPSQWNDAP